MKIPVFTCLSLAAFFCFALPAQAAEPTADEVAGNIQKLYENTKDFKAAFSQTYSSAILGRNKVSSGYVYVKKPGMMRWDYNKPRPKHFVADGKALYIFDPELEQVMVDRQFSGSQLSTAVTFLWGRGKLSDEFKITFSKRKDLLGADRHVLEMVPKNKARFQKLWFVVEKKTFRVLETIILDPGGNENRIGFSKMATNVGLKAAAFKFKIPKGMEVVEAPRAPTAKPTK